MAIEAILGGIVGGVTRLAPEVLSFFDKKNERKHELALGDQQFKVLQLQASTTMAVKDMEVDQSRFTAGVGALQEAIEAQARPSGIRWVDAFAALIRPGVTVWIFLLYSMVKTASLTVVLKTASMAEAVLSIWGPNDEAMLASVLMFWFVGRIWDRASQRWFR